MDWLGRRITQAQTQAQDGYTVSEVGLEGDEYWLSVEEHSEVAAKVEAANGKGDYFASGYWTESGAYAVAIEMGGQVSAVTGSEATLVGLADAIEAHARAL